MQQPNQLSLEQEFELRVFKDHVQQLSQQEAQELLVELYRNTIVLDNFYREIIKDTWDIGGDFGQALELRT